MSWTSDCCQTERPRSAFRRGQITRTLPAAAIRHRVNIPVQVQHRLGHARDPSRICIATFHPLSTPLHLSVDGPSEPILTKTVRRRQSLLPSFRFSQTTARSGKDSLLPPVVFATTTGQTSLTSAISSGPRSVVSLLPPGSNLHAPGSLFDPALPPILESRTPSIPSEENAHPHHTVATLERVAATKVFFETFYHGQVSLSSS